MNSNHCFTPLAAPDHGRARVRVTRSRPTTVNQMTMTKDALDPYESLRHTYSFCAAGFVFLFHVVSFSYLTVAAVLYT